MTASNEIATGGRFAFGENWGRFLDVLDDDRIRAAEMSLTDYLGRDDLTGLRFVDVGSGSGLFSLAARNLGAEVVSFDYDPQSVACTCELRRRYHPDDQGWRVEHGSALDADFLGSLGQFDVVYSWGVLHHTGDMWRALDLVTGLVKPGGRLFVSIYNDQGTPSKVWRRIKARYNRSGKTGRAVIFGVCGAYFRAKVGLSLVKRKLRHLPPAPVPRGMDRRRDLLDWVGGYPFEVATPAQITGFYVRRGFTQDKIRTVGRNLGCNEFVFTAPGSAYGAVVS